MLIKRSVRKRQRKHSIPDFLWLPPGRRESHHPPSVAGIALKYTHPILLIRSAAVEMAAAVCASVAKPSLATRASKQTTRAPRAAVRVMAQKQEQKVGFWGDLASAPFFSAPKMLLMRPHRCHTRRWKTGWRDYFIAATGQGRSRCHPLDFAGCCRRCTVCCCPGHRARCSGCSGGHDGG